MLTLLIYLSPMLLLIAIFGVVSIVALCQARPEDVPTIFTEATRVFGRLNSRHELRPGGDTENDEEEAQP
ncbi:hypothetical protein H4696_000496 [Amycolatopsis lexingtonensis]|uniref:Uncharacterized protein n=1 Tax=Amycolatopsis lexingtonensis TaxID=218822 RepID=A0ABR9HR35_9PSEU|nr:hypothetical protein [Amycolatopsis lexingtonensis]MBE1493396.1 hypothetical protein [Amycolatopsis lexingtonensis]